MQAALPQVTEEEVPDLLPPCEAVQFDDEGIHSSERDRDILPNGEPEPLLENVPARPPQRPELVRVVEDGQSLPSTQRGERRADPIEPRVRLGGLPRLDLEQEQRGVARPVRLSSIGDRRGALSVEILHRGNSAFHHPRKADREAAQRHPSGEGNHDPFSKDRFRRESDGDLGCDAQGPLASDEQLEQVRTHRAFSDPGAEMDPIPRAEDRFDFAHPGAGRTVPERPRARGIRSYVPADRAGRPRPRVRRKEEPVRQESALQLPVHDPWLDPRPGTVRVDLEESGPSGEVDHDGAVRGDRFAIQGGSPAPGHEGNT